MQRRSNIGLGVDKVASKVKELWYACICSAMGSSSYPAWDL